MQLCSVKCHKRHNGFIRWRFEYCFDYYRKNMLFTNNCQSYKIGGFLANDIEMNHRLYNVCMFTYCS